MARVRALSLLTGVLNGLTLEAHCGPVEGGDANGINYYTALKEKHLNTFGIHDSSS